MPAPTRQTLTKIARARRGGVPKKLAARAMVLAFLWLACCGGNVVVDGSGASSTTSSDNSSSGTGAATTASADNDCAGVDPSTLTPYNGSLFGGENCNVSYSDNHGDTYRELCNSGACTCQKNGATVCSCMLTGSLSCSTSATGCCFGI